MKFEVQTVCNTAGAFRKMALIDSKRNTYVVDELDFEGVNNTVSYGYRAGQRKITSIVYL